MGKDWSKGLTAATDPRVARAAAAHRGMRYQRRTPVENCRWPLAGQTTLPIEWSDEMAYIVGLTATDGCLITGRRAINFKSGDRQLVETYLQVLGRTNRVKTARTRKGGTVFLTQFHDSRLYEWFRSVGLTPRKSLTLGAIDVPDKHIAPLCRGLMDGDGSIANFVHAPTLRTYPDYRYERLLVQFNSASRAHIDWLRGRLHSLIADAGSVRRFKSEGKHDQHRLEFGKYSSIALLQLLYADPDAPRLMRKWLIWNGYVCRNRSADGGSRTSVPFDSTASCL